MKNNIIITITLAIFLLASCTGGVNLNQMENVPLSSPIAIGLKQQYGAALAENHKVWQWEFDDNYNIVNLVEIDIPNVHSMGLNLSEGMGWAVDAKGKVWFWFVFNPSEILPVETKKPVKKMIMRGRFITYLYTDGTLSPDPPVQKKDSIHFKEFEGIKDVFMGGVGEWIVAINTEGDVMAACKDGLSSLIIEGEPTKDGHVVKLPGLKNIKKFTMSNRYYYAIDEQDSIHYWNEGFRKKGIQTLDVLGNNIGYDRIMTGKGANYELVYASKYGVNPTINSADNLPFPDGYGFWYLNYYYTRGIAIDRKGQLWLFDYDVNAKATERVSNSIRIGDFKVTVDYYQE